MAEPVSRRDAVKQLAGATAGVALAGVVIRGQSDAIVVAGKPVEIVVRSISPSTLRITAFPVGVSAASDDGALVSGATGRTLARRRDVADPGR